MKRNLFGLIVLASSFLFSSTAMAANVTLSAIPKVSKTTGYYREDVKPGDAKKYSFILTNKSPKPEEIVLYPTDVKSGQNGGRDFKLPTEQVTDVGSWFKESKEEVTLKANETRTFTYHVRVPKDISEGQYIAIIGMISKEDLKAIESSSKGIAPTTSKDNSESSIDMNTQDGKKIYAYVANKQGIQIVMDYKPSKATHSMSISETTYHPLSTGSFELLIGVRNSGTILEHPVGSITILDKNNKIVHKNQVVGDSIYGNTTTNMRFEVGKLLNPGKYKAQFTLDYSGTKITKEFMFEIKKDETLNSANTNQEQSKINISALKKDDSTLNTMNPVYILVGVIVLLVIFSIVLLVKMKGRKKRSNRPYPVNRQD